MIIDDDDISSSAEHLAPLFDRIGGTADVAPAATVAPISIAGADMAALGVDGRKAVGLAKPVGADADGIVHSSVGPAPVAPPAVTAHELTHSLIYLLTESMAEPPIHNYSILTIHQEMSISISRCS